MNECQVIDTRVNGHSIAVPQRHKALPALLLARDRARSSKRDVWQYAVLLDELKHAGVRFDELRELVARGFVAHAIERGSMRNGQRRFQTVKSLNFTENSCFVLTVKGELVARRNGLCAELRDSSLSNDEANKARDNRRITTTPKWNVGSRILSLGGLVIKKFKRPAPHQELLLESFQELNWVHHIDDPIPPEKGIDAKGRLHDVIKKLNQRQLNPLIRFFGDGTGRGACWELRWHVG